MSVFGRSELFEEFENPDVSDTHSSSESDESIRDEYKEKYKSLKVENEKLKKSLRLLERPVNIKIRDSSNDGPVAHIILFNNVIARKFREEIKDFFYDLSNRRLRDDDSPVCTEPQPTYVQYTSPTKQHRELKKSSRRTETVKRAFQAFSSVQIYKNFYFDQLGEPLSFEEPKFSDWFLPDYDKLEYEPMNGDPEDFMQTRKRKKLQRICFNCGGSDHQMKDCEKSKDHQAINERRQKFMDEVAKHSSGSPQIRVDGPRYHEDDDEDQAERFKDFKPGVISAELQEALGITEEDIPPYIYQMRRLGYPPGHLQNARVKKSELALYDNCESNEENKENQYVPVEVSKLIGYPGFNIPPLPGQDDKYKEHCVDPMNEAQSKEVMVSYFEHRNNLFNQRKQVEQEAKERKEKERNLNRNDADMEEVDMEMGDDDGEQENIHPQTPPSPVRIEKKEGSELEEGEVDEDEIEAEVGSLTEDELEIKREMLLKELKKAANDSKNDSDYRNIKSSDQDYRIPASEVVDLTNTTSESDSNQTVPMIVEENEIIINKDLQVETAVVDSSPENIHEKKSHEITMKERSASSDTDYRMNPAFLSTLSNENSPSSFNIETVEDRSELDTPHSPDPELQEPQTVSSDIPDADDSNSEQSLPSRNQFAKGITQFDAYYTESKSQGVYKKLRTLLKDSPRRQKEWEKDVFS